jgi:hypothetical protein
VEGSKRGSHLLWLDIWRGDLDLSLRVSVQGTRALVEDGCPGPDDRGDGQQDDAERKLGRR